MTYTDEQWIEDWELCLRLQGSVSPSAMRGEMRKAFHAKYGDESPERFARFGQAMTCLSQHDQEFDYGDVAAVGERQGLASRALILGLKDYFCSLPASEIERAPDFDDIRRAIRARQ